MRTPGGWIIAVLAIPCIYADAWLAYNALFGGPYGADPGRGPSGFTIFVGLVAAGLAGLGLYGIVDFARHGSVRWLVATILGTLTGLLLIFAMFMAVAW